MIELCIPIELTAVQILRANPKIPPDDAHTLALELHAIVGRIQQYYADRPRIGRESEFEAVDLITTILRTALDIWPEDKDEAANESVWIAGLLGPMGDLHDRYLRLSDRIDESNIADEFDLYADPCARPQ